MPGGVRGRGLAAPFYSIYPADNVKTARLSRRCRCGMGSDIQGDQDTKHDNDDTECDAQPDEGLFVDFVLPRRGSCRRFPLGRGAHGNPPSFFPANVSIQPPNFYCKRFMGKKPDGGNDGRGGERKAAWTADAADGAEERCARRRRVGQSGAAADGEAGRGAGTVRRTPKTDRRGAGRDFGSGAAGSAGEADTRSFSFCPGKDKLDSGDSHVRNERREDVIHAVLL